VIGWPVRVCDAFGKSAAKAAVAFFSFSFPVCASEIISGVPSVLDGDTIVVGQTTMRLQLFAQGKQSDASQ
jgi:hypothetical protein